MVSSEEMGAVNVLISMAEARSPCWEMSVCRGACTQKGKLINDYLEPEYSLPDLWRIWKQDYEYTPHRITTGIASRFLKESCYQRKRIEAVYHTDLGKRIRRKGEDHDLLDVEYFVKCPSR